MNSVLAEDLERVSWVQFPSMGCCRTHCVAMVQLHNCFGYRTWLIHASQRPQTAWQRTFVSSSLVRTSTPGRRYGWLYEGDILSLPVPLGFRTFDEGQRKASKPSILVPPTVSHRRGDGDRQGERFETIPLNRPLYVEKES